MSFLAKLSQLRKKPATKVGEKTTDKSSKPASNIISDSLKSESSLLPQKYVREEDPAIRRLKELRRKEQLKNAPKNKPSAPSSRKKKDENSATATETRFRRKVGHSSKPQKPAVPARREPLKKLSFDELMREAEKKASDPSIDPKTSAVQNNTAKNSKPRKLNKPGFNKGVRRISPAAPVNKPREQKEPVVKLKQLSIPKPSIAQPGEKLRKKLDLIKKKRQGGTYGYDEEEEDLDDFIEDDEEEQGFNRDEIWAIFNKGKRRQNFENDYDSDDMEANEMEIFEEEERATKMARLEDKREEEWLKRHEQEKKRKFVRP
ncbi:LAQU0S06e01024g1_1 [Lachancea quebecensis]|uniref:LAQU0S06e01024g1_1 n=1 Tax=Lachancea quebecensis TaxID=1654605 RepID=A0A0P1KSM4_9SACH|nr:LAQU0S06e01024g1_1 [Lachancea quebecensis]